MTRKSKKQPRYKQPPKGNTTSLRQHARQGKVLRPPLMGLSNMAFQSWANDRLPEMLWATLVITQLPREQALAVFRAAAGLGFRYRVPDEMPDEDIPDLSGYSIGHSALAELDGQPIEAIVAFVERASGSNTALRPLLLLPHVPGFERWQAALGLEPEPATDWVTLATAVAETMDHQSQSATDVRWLRVMFMIAAGRVYFPPEFDIEPLRAYPHVGDMRSVRPMIRSMEGAFSTNPDGTLVATEWARQFWDDVLVATSCIAPPPEGASTANANEAHDWPVLIDEVREAVLAHWFAHLKTTAVDARSDAAFGFSLYALSCLQEMAATSIDRGIAGRLLLRTLVECRISLAHLAKGDDPAIWTRYRAYGTGQAKLALLKWDMVGDDQVSAVDPSILHALANEDYWQEFVNIELGHWCGKDLRKMSEEAGCKDDYDRYYGWTSTFVHGQWGALRDTEFAPCANPLHRLHRIPLPRARSLEHALPDGVRLVNAILNSLSALYPGCGIRLPE